MSTPRQQLAAAFQADQPGWLVSDFPDVPANVSRNRPVLSVWRGEVVPATLRTNLGHSITINAYGAKRAGAGAEDELDEILDAVMLTLERFPGWVFDRAARQSFANDTIAGWQITGSVYSPNHYRAIALQERSTNGSPAA